MISFNQRLMIGEKIGEKIWDNYETYETHERYETIMRHMRHASINSPLGEGAMILNKIRLTRAIFNIHFE